MRAARASMTTETTIFTVAQPMMFTVLVSGEIVPRRLGCAARHQRARHRDHRGAVQRRRDSSMSPSPAAPPRR
jgi:hypothetical protein